MQSLLVNPVSAKVPKLLHPPPLALWMAMSIASIAALAYWDEERESAAALSDFASEQETLAHAISAALSVHMVRGSEEPGDSDVQRALRSLSPLDRREGLRLFLAATTTPGFLSTDGQLTRNATIEHALSTRQSIARLSRDDASALGLQHRSAVAGIWPLHAAAPGHWAAIVVATTGGERDRQRRATWRLLLSVSLASGLVFLFGGSALRRQRQKLELARELDLAALARESDDRLVRADKLATLGALATGIAHEVSTPLGVIIGRAEQVLPHVGNDERSQRAVQAIIDQANRINQVMRGMLGLARGLAPRMEHVDPGKVARAACELVQHRFTKAGVKLELTLQSDLAEIACEPRLFEQVLVNLLLNACDACEYGGHVSLEVHTDHERVAFVVLDDGSGISALAAARATEPFFTTKAEDKGTGLGLAIANEIVKHHHGSLTIAARSQDQAAFTTGTRAAVELPVWRGQS